MHFTEAIESRMTEEEKHLLSDIYAPTEVMTPDGDPGFCSLTLLTDGRIRMYGHDGKRDVFDTGYHRSYQESTDGGLSWKRHIVADPAMLGASTYLPYDGVYLAATEQNGARLHCPYICRGEGCVFPCLTIGGTRPTKRSERRLPFLPC